MAEMNGFSIVDGSEFGDRQAANRAYLELINEAFGFDEAGEDFARLLPKLFGPSRDPASCTTFAVDSSDGRLLACAGRFPVTFYLGNKPVKAFGIGNVCARKELRNMGLMSQVMKAAVERMIEDGAVFSFLGGSRHRYSHFGFERTGVAYEFDLSEKTLKKLAAEDLSAYVLKPLAAEDGAALRFIAGCDCRQWRANRGAADMFDTLSSWHAAPYVLYKNGRPCGWAVIQDGRKVTEAVTVDSTDILPLLSLLGRLHSPLTVRIPEYDIGLFDALLPLAESWRTGADNCFNVLDYKALLSVMMELKAGCSKLADGCLDVVVNGIARTESLRIEVKNGKPSVSALSDTANALKLSHKDAMCLFFNRGLPLSRSLDPAPASWFPLPLYVSSPDDV